MHEVAIEYGALALVLVEAEIEITAQKSAALRGAEDVSVIDPAGAGVIGPRRLVAQKTRKVASRQKPEANHRRAGGRVNDVVKPAGNKARCEVDMARVGHGLAAVEPGKRPFLARDCHGWSALRLAHQQYRVRIIEIGGQIRAMRAVGKELHLARRVEPETDHQRAANRAAIRGPRLRHRGAHQAGDIRHIVLPAAPRHGIALPHHEPVAGIDRRTGNGGRRTVQKPHGDAGPAVGYVEEQPAIAACRLAREEDRDVGGETHQAPGITRRQANIRDAAIVGVGRIDREMRSAVDLLVGARRAEGSPLGERLAFGNLKTQHRHRRLPGIELRRAT